MCNLIKVACVKFGGLAAGGSERLLQSIAAYLPKDEFEVTYFYCDSAPYKGSSWKHPDTDESCKQFLIDNNVKLVKFHVGYKDITHPEHIWVDSNFFEVFREDDFDIIQTARAGHREYPFTHINETPIIDAITLPGMAEDKENIKAVFHISKFQAVSWMNVGGPVEKIVILPIFQNLSRADSSLRNQLRIKENDFVFGFHQRADDNIFSPISLEAFSRIKNENVHFVILGGSQKYARLSEELGISNFHQIPHTGDNKKISEFLNTLNVFCHTRADGETFGAVISEALFHGLPVVSHVAPAMGQIETIGPAGFVCKDSYEYERKMIELISDKNLRDDLGIKAKDHYERNFSVNACLDTLLSTYRRSHEKFRICGRTSFDAHNAEYMMSNALERETSVHENYTKNRVQHNPDSTLGYVLENKKFSFAFDIGSGTGWHSNLMSEYTGKVFGIEPSKHAQEISKKLYPENSKIEWINDFAQKALAGISIEEPALFNSSCVLSHLDDRTVKQICAEINRISKPGSCLSFSECHGMYFSDSKNLWHVRPKSWWKEIFPEWEFHFLDYPISHPVNSFKGFWAEKIR